MAHTLADLPAVNAPEHDAVVARIRLVAEAHTEAATIDDDIADAELRALFAVLADIDGTRYVVEAAGGTRHPCRRAPLYVIRDRWTDGGEPVAYRQTAAAARIRATVLNEANAADEAAALTASLDEYLAPTVR